MNFFTDIDKTQITRRTGKALDAFVPLHRRLFPIAFPREIAPAARPR